MKWKTVSIIIVCFSIVMFPLNIGWPQERTDNQDSEQAKAEEEDRSRMVTIDFEEADIRDVIKVIALASEKNMIIGEGVQAKVTMSLKDVHWERALDLILRTYNFTYKREENLIRIMTFEKIKQEERDIPLTTKIIYLNFANVSDLQATLNKTLSERGSIETDARTNSMLITDVPAKVLEIEKVAKKLDSRTPQVLIEAMLVDVKLTKDDELGINWQIVKALRPEDQSGTSDFDYLRMPSAINSASEAIGASWAQRLGRYGIDGLIKAWAQDAKANILASPKIVTLDNQTAKIEIKSQVAYTQINESTESGSVVQSTQFKDVVTGLEVTPHITKEGFISMNIKPRQEFVEATVAGEPQIGSRSAETNVLVSDGETIVIGGLRKVEDNATITKIPILGDLPLLGNFFRVKDLQKINTELVMFVTPHIIARPELTDEEIDRYQMLDDARVDFLKLQEKERRKRLKQRRQQAWLPELSEEFIEERALPEPGPKEQLNQPAPLAVTREKPLELKHPLESMQGYIFVW